MAGSCRGGSRTAELHPANRHVRDKTRQQLQVLRDLGLVEFLGGGRYRQNKEPGAGCQVSGTEHGTRDSGAKCKDKG
jgi:hypothetical protein